MTKSLHVKYNNDEYTDYFIDKYGNVINSKGKELRQRKINSGYLVVDLYKNKVKKTLLVHRAVAETFLKKKDNVINHKDGNKENNKVSNLEWVSYSKNNKHAYDTKLKEPLKGENSPFAKHTNEDAKKVCKLLELGYDIHDIAQETDFDIQFIKSIKSKTAWTSVSNDFNLPKTNHRTHKKEKAELKELAKHMSIKELCEYKQWPYEPKYIRRIRRAIK